MKRSIKIRGLSGKWTILLLIGVFAAMYGYNKKAGATFVTLVDPPGACRILGEDFKTEDGGCKDLATGIVWSADTCPAQYTWSYAVNYCDNLDEGGYNDWVLPTKDELIEAALNGAIDYVAMDPLYSWKWSRTEKGTNFAWMVDLANGDAFTTFKVRSSVFLLCSRHPASGGSNAPADLTATAVSTSQINLTWTDHSADEDGFKIERSLDGVNWPPEFTHTVGPDVTSYSDGDLAKKTTYYYRVRAYGFFGFSDYSNTASAKTKAH